MFTMYNKQMNMSTDASWAPACQSARYPHTVSANVGTAVEAVSVLILGVLVLISGIVRIIVPVPQS